MQGDISEESCQENIYFNISISPDLKPAAVMGEIPIRYNAKPKPSRIG